jgi:hypothetical protein
MVVIFGLKVLQCVESGTLVYIGHSLIKYVTEVRCYIFCQTLYDVVKESLEKEAVPQDYLKALEFLAFLSIRY